MSSLRPLLLGLALALPGCEIRLPAESGPKAPAPPPAAEVPREDGRIPVDYFMQCDDAIERCMAGECVETGGPGFSVCSSPCASDGDCPASGRCTDVGGRLQCMLRCERHLDCFEVSRGAANVVCTATHSPDERVCTRMGVLHGELRPEAELVLTETRWDEGAWALQPGEATTVHLTFTNEGSAPLSGVATFSTQDPRVTLAVAGAGGAQAVIPTLNPAGFLGPVPTPSTWTLPIAVTTSADLPRGEPVPFVVHVDTQGPPGPKSHAFVQHVTTWRLSPQPRLAAPVVDPTPVAPGKRIYRVDIYVTSYGYGPVPPMTVKLDTNPWGATMSWESKNVPLAVNPGEMAYGASKRLEVASVGVDFSWGEQIELLATFVDDAGHTWSDEIVLPEPTP